MRHLVREAELLNRRRAVATADDRRRFAVYVRESLRHRLGARRQRRIFKYAHGAVPNDRFCARDHGSEQLSRLGTDIEPHHVRRDCVRGNDRRLDRRVDGVGEGLRRYGIHGKNELFIQLLRLFEHFLAVADLLLVHEGSADFSALRLDESIGHSAADDERIALFEKVGNDVQLVRNLGSAEDRHERALRIFQRVRHHRELLFDEEAADRRLDQTFLHDSRGGRMGAVRRSERIVHVDVAVARQRLHEIGILLFLALMEAQVFEQDALALFTRRDFLFRVLAHDVGREGHLSAQKLAQTSGDGRQTELLDVLLRLFERFRRRGGLFRFGQGRDLRLLLLVQFELRVEHVVGLAHVRAEDHLRAVLHEVLDRGQRADDSVFVRDRPVLHRNVEVASDEDSLALYVYVFYRFLIHKTISLHLIFSRL